MEETQVVLDREGLGVDEDDEVPTGDGIKVWVGKEEGEWVAEEEWEEDGVEEGLFVVERVAVSQALKERLAVEVTLEVEEGVKVAECEGEAVVEGHMDGDGVRELHELVEGLSEAPEEVMDWVAEGLLLRELVAEGEAEVEVEVLELRVLKGVGVSMAMMGEKAPLSVPAMEGVTEVAGDLEALGDEEGERLEEALIEGAPDLDTEPLLDLSMEMVRDEEGEREVEGLEEGLLVTEGEREPDTDRERVLVDAADPAPTPGTVLLVTEGESERVLVGDTVVEGHLDMERVREVVRVREKRGVKETLTEFDFVAVGEGITGGTPNLYKVLLLSLTRISLYTVRAGEPVMGAATGISQLRYPLEFKESRLPVPDPRAVPTTRAGLQA